MGLIAEAWKRLEENEPQPTRYRGIVVMPWVDFAERIAEESEEFVQMLTRSLYSGDLWVLGKSFSPAFMYDLQDRCAAWMATRPASFHKMLEESPDFHRIIDQEAGKKYAFRCCKHAAYFYRWNNDPLGIWQTITERWRVAKMAMGLEPNEYESFTPKDGVVDRIQIVRYPPAIGYLEPHSDPWMHNRLFFSSYMSQRGVDYHGGGFYAVDRKDRAIELESLIEVGDSTLGYATVVHGVAPCDRGKTPSWEEKDGRWFLSLYECFGCGAEPAHRASGEGGSGGRAALICFSPTDLDRAKLEQAKVSAEALQDDGADYAGEVIRKPWGEERELRKTESFSIWRLAINVGQETSMHCHTQKACVLEVQSGEVTLGTLSGDRKLAQGDCVLLEPGFFHRLRAPGGAVVIELEWPPNRRDLVRISDLYGRQGRGYAD